MGGGMDGVGGPAPQGGQGDPGGAMAQGGADAMGGAMVDGFVDPDEGEPMEYAPPAQLDGNLAAGEMVNCPADHTFVSVARGWVVDRIGRPIDQAMVQLCIEHSNGTAECLTPRNTDAEGVFEMRPQEGKQCLTKMVFRAIKPGEFRTPSPPCYNPEFKVP